MEETNFKIDEDLIEYLKHKKDAEKIINDAIRNIKTNDTEWQQFEKSRLQEDNSESKTIVSVPQKNDGTRNIIAYIFFVLLIIAVFLLCLKECNSSTSVNYRTSSYDNARSEKDSVAPTSEASSVEKTESKITWDFQFETDKMTSSKNIWASISSDNSVDLEPPYHSTRASITIRYMKKFGGYDAIISITDGQIYGNEYSNDNYILARFDNGQPIKYWFNEPSDGSSESIFIRRKSDFIAHCKKAKDIKIEIPIFEGGRPIFEFHVDEPLKWKSE